MQRPVLIGQILGAVMPRLNAGGDVPPPGFGGLGEWVVTFSSLLAVLAVGGAAVRVARRLDRRSVPELVLLLDQSVEFYSRWPEDRLAGAPHRELVLEASRCRRIIELLELQSGAGAEGGPATRGPIEGLQAWAALLHSRITQPLNAPAGPAYA
jgi:hypothetical protein